MLKSESIKINTAFNNVLNERLKQNMRGNPITKNTRKRVFCRLFETDSTDISLIEDYMSRNTGLTSRRSFRDIKTRAKSLFHWKRFLAINRYRVLKNKMFFLWFLLFAFWVNQKFITFSVVLGKRVWNMKINFRLILRNSL